MRRMLWRRTRKPAWVVFCDACGTVCDRRCEARALREEVRTRAMTFVPRL